MAKLNAGRSDYSESFRSTSIPSDEPVFLIRGQDLAGAETVRAWAAFEHARGAPLALIEQGLRTADAMDKWAHRKVPGDDHLSDNERKQLEYAFTRRSWDWGKGSGLAVAGEHGFVRGVAWAIATLVKAGYHHLPMVLLRRADLKAEIFAEAGCDEETRDIVDGLKVFR